MINADNVNITTSKGKVLLQQFNLSCVRGELVAVMGPSGSGKTTLLDMLTHNLRGSLTYSGSLSTNGVVKYVAQEDLLHSFYTVRQYLSHYISMNYYGISNKARQAIIEEIAERTGLLSALDTKVGDVILKGLSGGQKRRLSIALELVSRPDVLVLDEPTSGLDSLSALRIFEVLKDLTKDGLCVVCTLHQPSSQIWNQIDRVILLSGGYTCYSGGFQGAENFFQSIGRELPSSHFNPADFLILQINSDFNKDINPADISQKFTTWKASTEKNQLIQVKPQIKSDVENLKARSTQVASEQILNSEAGPLDPENKKEKWLEALSLHSSHRAGGFQKFGQLLIRNMLNTIKNPGIIGIRLVMYFMLSFMVGFMYFNLGSFYEDADIISRTSLLFYVDAFLVFMSIAVLPFFLIERKIIEKEVKNKLYRSFHYQIARLITSLAGVVLIAIMSSGLVAGVARLNGFGVFFMILFLSLVIAESLAFFVSLCVPHYIIGMALIAGLYGMFMLCEGFLIVKDNIPGYFVWVYWMAFHTYSFKGFMYNEFSQIDTFNSVQFPTGESVLKFYQMDDLTIWQIALILIGYTFLIEIFIFVVFNIMFRRKRIQK